MCPVYSCWYVVLVLLLSILLLNQHVYKELLLLILLCCCCCLLSQSFSPRYFSTNGDPHRSSFKFPNTILILPLLCVTFLVQLSFVVNLLHVFLVWLPDFSRKLLLLYYYYYYFIILLFYHISFVLSHTHNGGNLSEASVNTHEITINNIFTPKTDVSNDCVKNIAISHNSCSRLFTKACGAARTTSEGNFKWNIQFLWL